MLTFLGISMVIVFTYLIMAKKLSPVTALVVVPIVFAVCGGFGLELGDMMLDGIKQVAPSAVLLLFAILFFGILIDAGLFDPLINKIMKFVKGDPVKIAIGTAIIAMTVALDGDGTTTHMITISAMLALYLRINMNPLVLATISMLSVSIMSGMTPWGGPATRAIASLGLDANEFFLPILPTMLSGMVSILFISYVLGKKEREKIGIIPVREVSHNELQLSEAAASVHALKDHLKRPHLRWVNFLLAMAVMVMLVTGFIHDQLSEFGAAKRTHIIPCRQCADRRPAGVCGRHLLGDFLGNENGGRHLQCVSRDHTGIRRHIVSACRRDHQHAVYVCAVQCRLLFRGIADFSRGRRGIRG